MSRALEKLKYIKEKNYPCVSVYSTESKRVYLISVSMFESNIEKLSSGNFSAFIPTNDDIYLYNKGVRVVAARYDEGEKETTMYYYHKFARKTVFNYGTITH